MPLVPIAVLVITLAAACSSDARKETPMSPMFDGGGRPSREAGSAGLVDAQSPGRVDGASAAGGHDAANASAGRNEGGVGKGDAASDDNSESDGLITIERGELPIVLSAPHGGETPIAGVSVRTSAAAVTTLDFATYDLALAVQQQLVARTGRRAHLVAALASRKYVDFNRDAAGAYESPAAAPIYGAYHAALARAVGAAKAQSSAAALLVDIHGQSAEPSLALRGTRDGQTADLATLHATPGGFLTGLLARGVQVSPASSTKVSENPSFNGGFIVGSQGLSGAGKINAVQLELGSDYREPSAALMATARQVADALVEHLRTNGAL